MWNLAAIAAFVVGSSQASSTPGCRCTPPDPCWLSIPWAALNASVGGRLVDTSDPLEVCLADLAGPACAAALNATDNEFAVTGESDGFTRTGLFGTWNSSSVQSAYVLLAESEEDVSAGVAFAAAHNLRVTVKGTGHGWFHGGTAPGALLIWTHLRKNITFLSAWQPPCGGDSVAAVVVETGVQFAELYSAAAAAGTFVVGGTCDSVGVGGCWMGGCWGKWSRLYGPAAVNLLEARVVLANGSIVVASTCSNPDLFWALRGGGGGTFGVVTSFTARTHAPPQNVLLGNTYISAAGVTAFTALVEAALNSSLGFMEPVWGGSVGFGRAAAPAANDSFYISLDPAGFEVPQAVGETKVQALLEFARAGGPSLYPTVQSSWSNWTVADGPPFPWVEVHPDREISTSLIASMSKWAPNVPRLRAGGAPELTRVSQAFVEMVLQLPQDAAGTFNLAFEKAAAGADAASVETMLNDTSINPIVAEAMGLLLVAYRYPELPTLPPSSTVLGTLWPRLQKYVVLGPSDPLFTTCATGAAGNETAAVSCLNSLAFQRTPALQAGLRRVNSTLWDAFPNFVGNRSTLQHVSGSYYNEGDWWDPEWRRSHWGPDERYKRLRPIKDRYDPAGLFVCHHCVGSEDWDASGNCRLLDLQSS